MVDAVNEKIDFGIITTGSITSPQGINTYTFSGEAGDSIVIRISKTSGNLWPRITLYGPSGKELNLSYGPADSEIVVKLTSAGTNKIRVDDGFQGKFTGNYTLFVQRVNNPGNVKSSEFEILKLSSINQPGTIETYSFSGRAGDTVMVRITKTSGTLWPRITLYGPTGEEITRNYGPSITEIVTKLTLSGPYTILVDDGFRGTFIGDYSFLSQRISVNDGSAETTQNPSPTTNSPQKTPHPQTTSTNQTAATPIGSIPIWDRNNLIYLVLLVFVFLFGVLVYDTYYKKKK